MMIMITISSKAVVSVLIIFLFISPLIITAPVGEPTADDCGCQTPPPPPSVAPAIDLVFADVRLAVVYPIIQKFKNIITSDPLGITNSWVGSDICSYEGFYCDNPLDNNTAVVLAGIDFNGFHLAAPTLDGFLDQLPDLAIFHANSNNFSGTISPDVAKLPFLYEFDISNNLFSGQFPEAILGMRGLTFLDVRFNFFTGAVPQQVYALDLDVLFLNNNNFMQRLPDINDGGRGSNVQYLTLANNRFFGPIPRGIAKLFSSLSEVLLLNNRLSGCLPYELGFLDDAVVFDASNNRLTGPLPFSLGCLKKVEVINFAGNMLYGVVPEVLCALASLTNLSLSDNYFIHVGPLCRRLIKTGVLDVRKNCIPGIPSQRPLIDCLAFFSVPRYCPFKYTYTSIPCWLPHFSSAVILDSSPSPS